MKINLTKLLESPTRVTWCGLEPRPDTAAYYIERESRNTAPESSYSFTLERRKTK